MSYSLTALSLLSALISLLPFKFNETIEKAVDDTFEGGRRHVREEFKRFENATYKPHNKSKKAPASPPTPPSAQESPEPELDKEDPSRFMPK